MALYVLYYADEDKEEIDKTEFDSYGDLIKHVNNIMLDKTNDRVYLYSYGGLENPIIASCNHFHIRNSLKVNGGFKEHHIQEYLTYEEAFKVATEMMEPHELCYENNRIGNPSSKTDS